MIDSLYVCLSQRKHSSFWNRWGTTEQKQGRRRERSRRGKGWSQRSQSTVLPLWLALLSPAPHPAPYQTIAAWMTDRSSGQHLYLRCICLGVYYKESSLGGMQWPSTKKHGRVLQKRVDWVTYRAQGTAWKGQEDGKGRERSNISEYSFL